MKEYYHIVTYGCQMNVHESEKIAGILESLGYTAADSPEQAQVVLFNTCCIRENAEHRAYGNIGALKNYKRKNPEVIIGVCGCMTQQKQTAEDLRRKFPFVDIVLGTHNLNLLKDAITACKKERKDRIFNIEEKNGEMDESIPVSRSGSVNAWVNIMYGCNNFCTYCIVPYVRGRERSRDFDTIVREVKQLLTEGYREITLLGQNVNSYGNDVQNGKGFAELLTVLAELPYRYRLRFMTSHPKDLTDEVIDTIAKYPNLCKYIHLPVQAGSDRILAAMNRKYTSEQYLSLVKKIREGIPGVQISSDIMVGFPGETEADFQDTLTLVEKANFSNAFTFVYSRRAGTVADRMENQISEDVKKDRIQRLIALQNEVSETIGKQYVGKVFDVLFERCDNGVLTGKTDCGKQVTLHGDESLIGKLLPVKIQRSAISSLEGCLILGKTVSSTMK